MASKKGTLLEKNVERLLRLAGFKPELNKVLNGYELDVYINHKNKRIAFECKQYEKSSLSIRNLIHQWDSKNKELNLDKIVFVLVGSEISERDYELAKKYNIALWDENDLERLLEGVIKKGEGERGRIIDKIGIYIDDEEYQKLLAKRQAIKQKDLEAQEREKEIERLKQEINDKYKEREKKIKIKISLTFLYWFIFIILGTLFGVGTESSKLPEWIFVILLLSLLIYSIYSFIFLPIKLVILKWRFRDFRNKKRRSLSNRIEKDKIDKIFRPSHPL